VVELALQVISARPHVSAVSARGGGKLCQPGDRPWRAMPRRAAFCDVVGRLVWTTHGEVAIVRVHRRLRAGQDGGHVLIRGPGTPDQRRGGVYCELVSKSKIR
jgi:hypothetical protein